MVTITLYARQKKRHRCIEQIFGLYGEGKGGMIWENSIETCILSSVKEITSPGWMHETSAQGWCTGMTQRDGMERKVGGGSGWGTHVNPWLIHVNVWQKPLQYCKGISLQLIKIIGGKKNTSSQQMCIHDQLWRFCLGIILPEHCLDSQLKNCLVDKGPLTFRF